MNKHFAYYLLCLLILHNGLAISQTHIEIINADEISFNKKVNEDRQVLIGNVKTKHQNRYLVCDSAYFYSKENKIEAFSNIHIWQGDTLNLKGDHLVYYGDHQLAEIQKNVYFTHNEMELSTEQLRYNFEVEKAYFDHKAEISQIDKLLYSNRGVYYAKLEKFDFFDDVNVFNGTETLSADTLYYWLKTEYAEFRSNGNIKNNSINVTANKGWVNQHDGSAFLSDDISITELDNEYVLHADTCIFSEQMNYSISYSNTLLVLPFEADSLFITADSIIHDNTINTHILRAYNDVAFQSKNTTGKCDSLNFYTEIDLIILNNKPVLWLDEFQLSSDTITIKLKENTIKEAILKQSAFICSEIDSVSANQISGETMFAHFRNNELYNIRVEGNGESIYYVQDDNDEQNIGVNKIICSNMNIYLEDRKINNINFYEKPDAVLSPIETIVPEKFLLKGFELHSKGKIIEKIQSKTQLYYTF